MTEEEKDSKDLFEESEEQKKIFASNCGLSNSFGTFSGSLYGLQISTKKLVTRIQFKTEFLLKLTLIVRNRSLHGELVDTLWEEKTN